MGEFNDIFTGMYERLFSSGSHFNEPGRYETRFDAQPYGNDTTGSALSGGAVVYEFAAHNHSGSLIYAMLFDLTGGPGPGYKPFFVMPVAATSMQSFSWRAGRTVHNGIQAGWSTDPHAFTASGGAGAFYIEYRR